MAYFTNQLLDWYYENKRDLPWRKTSDPYKIWLSEIILQQTRIDQGTDYYNKFILEFPNVRSLAGAKQEKVIKLWQGLGYYSRARNLHDSAKEIVKKHRGIIPDDYDDLIQLKGIGDYTAGAILSIAFNKPYPVVDGNVIRVISRVFGIIKPISSAAVISEIKNHARQQMPLKLAGTYNQAIMEFGALQCKPQSPDCAACCLKSICFAFKKNLVGSIPVKKTAVTVKERYLNYFLICSEVNKTRNFYLRKRTENDIWKNLYDLPCIETIGKTSFSKLKKNKAWKEIFGKQTPVLKNIPSRYNHKLSHQSINAVFYVVSVSHSLTKSEFLKEIKDDQFHKFPVPRLIEKFLVSQKLLH